ncbi:universal stress protein [Qipengyuania flava]|uniref:Universal stress protein n=1 Tax=Qipengyuania flava TaxID=192812 RepID=A0A5P6N9Z3_9SPHN|nr:universal stress protein [Qipengyuania flava]QFI62809.1 universal stress protein [Qipengyuania flava]
MYSRILVAVDLDEPSSWQKPIATALALADCFGAKVALAYVVPDTVLMLQAQWSVSSVRAIMEDARIKLMKVTRDHAADRDLEEIVRSGPVYAGLIEAGETFEADLIVLSSRRPEMKDYLLGANASRVVRHAKCSVMVVRD